MEGEFLSKRNRSIEYCLSNLIAPTTSNGFSTRFNKSKASLMPLGRRKSFLIISFGVTHTHKRHNNWHRHKKVHSLIGYQKLVFFPISFYQLSFEKKVARRDGEMSHEAWWLSTVVTCPLTTILEILQVHKKRKFAVFFTSPTKYQNHLKYQFAHCIAKYSVWQDLFKDLRSIQGGKANFAGWVFLKFL